MRAEKKRGTVQIVDGELEVDEDATDLFSVLAAGCDGDIIIKTPYGQTKFKQAKKVKRPKK